MRLRGMNPGEALAAAAAMTLRLGGFSKAAELMGELLMDTWAANFPGALGAYHRLTEYMLSSPARRVTGDLWRGHDFFARKRGWGHEAHRHMVGRQHIKPSAPE